MVVVLLLLIMLVPGCMVQEADFKKAIKQQDAQFSEARARQSHEISSLRDQVLPELQNQKEQTQHSLGEIKKNQDNLEYQVNAKLSQQGKQLGVLDATLNGQIKEIKQQLQSVQGHQVDQDGRIASLRESSEKLVRVVEDLRRDVLAAVKQNNDSLDRKVSDRLDAQRKELEVVDQRQTKSIDQYTRALTEFRTALATLDTRVTHEDQALSGHLDGVNKSVASVVKTLETVSQKLSARLDEQDRRMDSLARSVDQAAQKAGTRSQGSKIAQRSSVPPPLDTMPAEKQPPQNTESAALVGQAEGQTVVAEDQPDTRSASVASIPAPIEAPVVEPHVSAEPPADRTQYERVLALFRDGDLDGARRGFLSFIATYPNSDLAPNARYWLGEAYYGAKDFKRAIDAYDKVELDYPRSEKVPAAILKKGYAYLALKDKKRASTAFKQVVTLYPRSPEAGKASDKLVLLKEGR